MKTKIEMVLAAKYLTQMIIAAAVMLCPHFMFNSRFIMWTRTTLSTTWTRVLFLCVKCAFCSFMLITDWLLSGFCHLFICTSNIKIAKFANHFTILAKKENLINSLRCRCRMNTCVIHSSLDKSSKQ